MCYLYGMESRYNELRLPRIMNKMVLYSLPRVPNLVTNFDNFGTFLCLCNQKLRFGSSLNADNFLALLENFQIKCSLCSGL